MTSVLLSDLFPGSRQCDWRTALGADRARVVAGGWVLVVQRDAKGQYRPLGAFADGALANGYAAGCFEPEERRGLFAVHNG